MSSGEAIRKGQETCPAGPSGPRPVLRTCPRPWARVQCRGPVWEDSALFHQGRSAGELRRERARGGGICGWEGFKQEEGVGAVAQVARPA